MKRTWAAGAFALVVALGCTIDAVDYTGKSCPCPAPFDACVDGKCQRTRGESKDVKLTATVSGLEGDVRASLSLNGAGPWEVARDAPFELPVRLAAGVPFVLSATAPGHRCDDVTDTPKAGGLNVTLYCFADDATLSALAITRGAFAAALSPELSPDITDYRARLPLGAVVGAEPLSVTATAKSPSVKIMIDGTPSTSGIAALVPFDVGPRALEVTVSAASRRSKAYKLDVGAFATYLKASNTRDQSRFGTAVALSGDTLVVGAPSDSSNANGVNGNQGDTSAPGAGAVYVFTRTAGVWTQQAYVKASNARQLAYFGNSVALSGDTLVVGAPGESSSAKGVNGNQSNTSAMSAGAVYVFTRIAGVWTQQAYVKASNTRALAGFGSAVAFSGETLAVGASGESSNAVGVGGDQTNTSAVRAGAVYVFTRAAGVWTQQAYVKASNTRAAANFGHAVALQDDTLAVAAEQESSNAKGVNGDQGNTSAENAGAVYVFTRAAGVWTQQAYVKASNTRASARFGSAIALSGETLAVGSSGESSNAIGVGGNEGDTSAVSSGAVYLFGRTGASWSQQAYVKASNTRPSASFGSSVALSGEMLAVGSSGESSNATGMQGDQGNTSAAFSGAAYVFTRTNGSWAQRAYVKASNTATLAQFGESIAVSRDMLAVGASGESGSASGVCPAPGGPFVESSGAAYVY